jgi:hypothetical protein
MYMDSLTYNYYEALDKIEAFMHRSGIRKFCTEKCAGRCCKDCTRTCHLGIAEVPRPIICSVYICHTLLKRIVTHEEYSKYKKLMIVIRKEVQRGSTLSGRDLIEHDYPLSVYTQFSIDKNALNIIDQLDGDRIISIISKLDIRSIF